MLLPPEIKHGISERINKIVTRLRIIGKSVRDVLQLETSRPIATSNQSQSVAWNTRLTTSVPIEPKVYGRDAERDEIIEILINGKSSDLHVLSVVGNGGVGKTTLAKFVYGDQRVKDHFDLHVWVCVSTNFDKERLTIEILDHVCKDRQEYKGISSFNVLQETLSKYIRSKRFLLVLDDLWEDKDKSGWDELLAPLKRNQATGCMILVTTRSAIVAEMIGKRGDNKLIKVNDLDEKDFWLLFKAYAFGNENYDGHPSLQSIGQQIAKALKGSPLAARSVGALLYRNVSYEHWKTVQNKWKSLQEEEGGILPALKLSYDYLPFHLQRCFSYCSLFPEDHQFNGEVLVRAWISQNFVQCEDTSKGLEETGRQYLTGLVDFGFFQRVDSRYAMHDLMHELAEKVSSNECVTINGLQSKIIKPCIRHLSIITTGHDRDGNANFSSEKFKKILQMIGHRQKLRTLMFFGPSSVHLLRSFLTLCEEAKTLRFLRACATNDDVGSVLSILKPCHLRYVEFYCVSTRNIDIPQALTRFYHLQVLDVGISGNLATPTGMNNLVNLRYLIAHEKVHSAIACVSTMTSLQELKFKVQNSSDFQIRQLQSMNQLVKLGISQLENVKAKEEASGASLIDKEHLEELSLSWDESTMSPEPTTERTRDVLEGLEPHQNLKHLRITGYSGATSPTWLASNVSVTSLQTLHLENCREWRILGSLEMLPLLRKLTLVRMWNLMEVSIPSLEELVLDNMPKLEKCSGTKGPELTSYLRVLMVEDCPQLNEFTLFPSDSSFQAEQKSWFPTLNKLTIRRCPRIINWEILPLEEMRELNELELTDMHVVKELTVPSLEKLVLIEMQSLESCSGLFASPPLQVSPSQGEQQEWVSSLRGLTIHDCPSLIVSHPLPPSALISELSVKGVSTFPTMSVSWRQLRIESNELSVLDDKILGFHNLEGITELEIENCPSLISLSSEGFNQLTALETLRLSDCPNLLKSQIMAESFQEDSTSANSLVLPSLRSLSIWSCGIAGRRLTQMLPHLMSLEYLSLRDCPQIKLLSISRPTEAEEDGRLASAATVVASSAQDELVLKMPSNLLCSLKRLSIHNFGDLELCGGFGGFTSLQDLDISDCPKLLSLSSGESTMSPEPTTERTRDVLEGLEPHQNLKHLGITGYSGTTSPTWLASNVSVTSLQKLHLENCREWQILGSLQMLPLLRKLKLVNMWNLMEVSIPSLEELVLFNMPKLEKCSGTKGPELTSYLRVLMVEDCPQLNEFSLFQSDSSFQAEQKSWFPSLNKLTIGHCPRIINWEILPLEEMRELKELELMDVDVVKELTVPSLEKLVLIKMQSLESCSGLTASLPSLGEQKEWVSSLRRLTIHDCPSLIVSHPLPPSAPISELSVKGVPTFPITNVRWGQLTIESNELSVLDDKILAFHNLRGITQLEITNCPSLISLSSEVFNQLTALKTLSLRKCPNLLKSHILSESVQEDSTSANSLVLPSLKCLEILSCGIAGRRLTQMLPQMMSLERLTLSDCPQIKLLSISQPTEAEEDGRLAPAATVVASSAQDELVLKMPSNLLCSLKRLSIENLRDLEFFGGKGGFGGFNKLETLDISCPKLFLGETNDDGIANMHSYFPRGLKKLRLECGPNLNPVQLHSCTAVLEGLQFLSSLRTLEIQMNPELSAAWNLKLQEQEQGGNQIGLLPPSLDRLEIWILTDEVQSRLLSCLPRITKLVIDRSPKLTSLQLGYCTALEELEISHCESLAWIEGLQSIRNVRSLRVESPSSPPCLELLSQQRGASEILSRLETLEIGDASVLSMSFCKHLTSLRCLRFRSWGSVHGESMVGLTEEQEKALQLLTFLRDLQFWGYPNLLSLPANLRSLASLEVLYIFDCPSIARLPEMGLPPSLRLLQLYDGSEELCMQCRMAATEKLSVFIT